MRPFEFARPERVEEVLNALGPDRRAFAGGTDLLPLMKADIEAPRALVDLKRVLRAGIDVHDGIVTIGALTLLDDLERNEEIRQNHSALALAAGSAASPQLRNMATIGGNLLQRPRCWYFRNPRVQCWLKGGDECTAAAGDNRRHALFGEGPCRAVHPSDPAAALVALDAEVLLRRPAAERTMPLEQFFVIPSEDRRLETVLEEQELVLGVRLPRASPGTRSTYLKAMDRKAWTFALAGVAAALRISNEGRVTEARIVLSGVAPVPWRARGAEGVLLDAFPTGEILSRAADAAIEGAAPLAHNGYKVPLVRALVRRALEALVQD